MSYHRRVVVLAYDNAKLPMFNSNEEQDEFHRIIGKLVTYAMVRETDTPDSQQLVTIGAFDPEDMVAVYNVAQPDTHDDACSLDGQMRNMQGGRRPFVLGAVKHSDGKYGTHS